MRSQSKGTLAQRLQDRNIHGWRARINSTDKRRPSRTQERAVENLLLDAMEFIEYQTKTLNKYIDMCLKIENEKDHLQAKLDELTIHQLVGKK